MDIFGRNTVHRDDDVTDSERRRFGWAARRNAHDVESFGRLVKPHSGAIISAGVGDRARQRFQIHNLIAVIEGHDEALQDAAADIALIVVPRKGAFVLCRQRGYNIVDLNRAQCHGRAARNIAARGTADTPAIHGIDAFGMFGAQAVLFGEWLGQRQFDARTGVDIEFRR